jgi:hypothetical protein
MLVSTMPISEKDHFDALRKDDQRALELLANANAARMSTALVIGSILVSIIGVLVAIGAIITHAGKCV